MNGSGVLKSYLPTSAEWEPQPYLVSRWWKLVNESGNPVGLKVFIPDEHLREGYRLQGLLYLGEKPEPCQ